MVKPTEITSSDSDKSAVQSYAPAANDDNAPCIVIVGSGPSGVRMVHEVLRRLPMAKVTLFGDEPYQPYNRVQLSSLLAGEVDVDDIVSPLPDATQHPNFRHVYTHIRSIDTDNQTVVDWNGELTGYDYLVLAVGSRPHVPHIPGIDQTGVYTFRNLKDAESLYNRVSRARHVVIVGGGLLGLEAARALTRANTAVTVVQQGPRLMNRQLDDTAAQYLLQKVNALGIRIITNSGVRQIIGQGRVSGVITRDGDTILCDTVLLCAGIKPAVELARDARIKVSNGVVVDDQLQTSAPRVYAIGECCEHQGKTYGLVNPGLEQAAICADVLAKGGARYRGSTEISRLKVLGESVSSMGEVTNLTERPFQRTWVYNNRSKNLYRKLITHRGRLIGAVGFGAWPEFRRIQEAFQEQRRFMPWHYLRFLLTGEVWGDSANDDVSLWPATTMVCQCNNVSQGELVKAHEAGANSVAEISARTGAGTVCGSCKPLLENLVGQTGPREKERGWRPVLLASLLSLLVAATVWLLPGIQASDSVQEKAFLEAVWNDKTWKQVTGFTVLGLSALGLLMSLRKRFQFRRLGEFAYWRVFHILLGALGVITIVLHTGLHLGANLNRWLMLNFLAVIAVGALAGAMVSCGHLLSANRAQTLRRFFTWAHILVFWPLPVLLAAHIITVYYF